MKDKISPIGLKGYEITERMKELMGVTSINENKTTSVVELTKLGPDGKVYGIVRENHEYYIKVTDKKENIKVGDFSYIGGLKNKKQEAYPSYAKAIKHLNLKFNSLNEAYGKSEKINVFEDDNLMEAGITGFYTPEGKMFKNEGNLEGHMKSECCNAPIMDGMCSECGMKYETMDEYDKEVMDKMKDKYGEKKGVGVYYATANAQDRDPETFKKKSDEGYMDEELDETMQAVQDIGEDEMSDKEKKFAALASPKDKITYADKIAGATKGQKNEHRLSIEKAINEMSDIIESVVGPDKKKVYTIK